MEKKTIPTYGAFWVQPQTPVMAQQPPLSILEKMLFEPEPKVLKPKPKLVKDNPVLISKKAKKRGKKKKAGKKLAKKIGQNFTPGPGSNLSGDATNVYYVSGNTVHQSNMICNAANKPNVTGNVSNEPNDKNASGSDANPVMGLPKLQWRIIRKGNMEVHQQTCLGKYAPGIVVLSHDVPVEVPKAVEAKPSTPETQTPQDTSKKDPKPLVDSAAESHKGFTIPKLITNTRPKIVLKTKKNLQKEMAQQRNSCIKPNASDTRTEPTMHQGFEGPSTAPNANSAPGAFMLEQPQQAKATKPRGQRAPIRFLALHAYNYPKGIPRSFLKNQMLQNPGGQQMIQIPGGQQMTTVPGDQQMINPDSPIWPNINMNMPSYQTNAPTLVQQPATILGENMNPASSPIFVQTDNQPTVQQPYSPSDIYSESNPDPAEELESSEAPQSQAAQKRLSAFQRLGPVSQPKKPKLTINLTLNKEQPVREVVNATDDDPDRYTPVHLRKNVINSTDETVVKYLPAWPWRKNISIRRSATARQSRTVMILEQEQMEEVYEKDNFIQITVKGYPSTWTKERVLDAILESVRGYSLIPCFTEFYQNECKFLTLRCRSALITLHKTGFYIHKDGVELNVTISQTNLTLQCIDFIPRIVLRKRVAMGYADNKLNLSAFTLQEDISHFIYYPLHILSNQTSFAKLQGVIAWDQLTDLDLSHNRLTNISGFELKETTPRLKHLNISHNCLEKVTVLLGFKGLPLKSLQLEGNPLCHDYIDPDHYIKVVRLMFPTVDDLDGIAIHRPGQLAHFKQNYCPDDAKQLAEKFLEIYFPLLDSGAEHRSLIQGMYEEDAMLTITYCYKLRYSALYRCFRNLFLYARFLDEGETDSVVGAMAITKLINRWPHTEHDPFTFTVDVVYHTETTTILRIGGILKLTAETLADDEHLLSFTRTVVLYSEDGDEYKIHNEMVYWDEPTAALARSAFRVNTISQKKINLKIESTTDEDLRENYLKIFMKLTKMDKKICERCLEMNDWNFKQALEHFTKLLKLNNLDSLTKATITS